VVYGLEMHTAFSKITLKKTICDFANLQKIVSGLITFAVNLDWRQTDGGDKEFGEWTSSGGDKTYSFPTLSTH
jgi:hypothetical protein